MPKITIKSIENISEAAKQFVDELSNLQNVTCVAFYGEMGAGKTTFIQAICTEMGVIDVVNSPTFSIVNEYVTDTNRVIYHFDFYRINKESEVYDLGYEDYFYSGNLCFVEWPEKIEKLLPENYIKLSISVQTDGSRIIEF